MSVMTEGDQSSPYDRNVNDDKQSRSLRVESVEPMVATASRQHAIHYFLANADPPSYTTTRDLTPHLGVCLAPSAPRPYHTSS